MGTRNCVVKSTAGDAPIMAGGPPGNKLVPKRRLIRCRFVFGAKEARDGGSVVLLEPRDCPVGAGGVLRGCGARAVGRIRQMRPTRSVVLPESRDCLPGAGGVLRGWGARTAGRIRQMRPTSGDLQRGEVLEHVLERQLFLLGLFGHAVDLLEGRDPADDLEHAVGVKR